MYHPSNIHLLLDHSFKYYCFVALNLLHVIEASRAFLAVLSFPSNFSNIWTEYIAFLQMSLRKIFRQNVTEPVLNGLVDTSSVTVKPFI